MVVDKTTLIADFPDSGDLVPNENETASDADVVNLNSNTFLGWVTDLFNFNIDQSPQTGVATTYTALQNFGAGITTDAIGTYTTGGNLLVTTTGSGVLNYASGTAAASQVLTVANYSALVGPAAGVTDMTGATSLLDGAHGLAIKPVAGQQNYALTGAAVYSPVLRSSVDILNTGAIAAGQSFVGSGTNATVPAYVPTIANALAISGAPAAGKAPVATSSSAGAWSFVPTLQAAFNVTNAAQANYLFVATSASAGAWTRFNSATFPTGQVCQGRLTLTTGVPVTTSPVTAATTIYFTPYLGNCIALLDTGWNVISFTEVSVAVPSTTVTPFDIFAHNVNGTVTLTTVNWTNDTTRATALAVQDGVLVKTGETNKRYLGTGRTTGVSGQTQVTAGSLLLVNYYNQTGYELIGNITAGTWSTSNTVFDTSNTNTTVGEGRIEFLVGVQEQAIDAVHGSSALCGLSGGVNAAFTTGIGVDSTSVNSAQITQRAGTASSTQTTIMAVQSRYTGKPSVGYHYIQRLEKVSAVSATVDGTGLSALIVQVRG